MLLFISQKGLAQQHNKAAIDSLLLADSLFHAEDKATLDRCENLYDYYWKLNQSDKTALYIDRTIKLATRLKMPEYISRAYFYLGFYHHTNGRYIEAEDAYDKAIKKSTETGNKRRLGLIYENLGAMYANLPDNEKALNANLEAIAIFTDLGDALSVAACYVNVASSYKNLGQYKSAIASLEKAIIVFKASNGNEYGQGLSYANLGAVYYLADEKDLEITQVQKYQTTLHYLSLALDIANKLKYSSLLGNIYLTKAKVLSAYGSRNEALESFQKAIEYNKQITDKKQYVESLLALAHLFVQHEEYHDADSLLNEVLKISSNYKLRALQRDGHLAMSQMSEKQQLFTAALEHFKSYISYRDQIFNEENEREITRKRLRLDFLIKEKDYQGRQQLLSLELQKRTLEAKQRKQELILKEKEISIEKLAFLQRKTALEAEKQQKESELEQEQLTASLDRKQRDEKIMIQENKARLNQNLSIFLGILAFGLSGGALLVFRAQRKTARLNQLVSSQKLELEELGKVKDRILGMVSHDMRAPVNSLISFTRLLEHGNISEEKLKAYTSSLKDTLAHTSSMMENLLNWAYSQMQGFRPDLRALQISYLVQELVAAAEDDAGQKHIRVSFSQDSDATAWGDMNMMSLVIRNLLNNAIKFTPEGGSIDVNIQHSSRHILLSIADNGVGLAAAQLQWFNGKDSVRLGRSTPGTNREKGIGLGLTLCKTFAAMMHADLSVSSNEPHGTVFVLSMLYKDPSPPKNERGYSN